MSWRATSPGYIIEEYVGNSLVDNGFNVTQMVHQEVIQARSVVLLWCLEMLLVIFCVLLPVQTNMYSEIMAIRLAAEICVHKGFTNVVIETDSTIASLIMIQEVSAPWAVDTIVRKIITLLRELKWMRKGSNHAKTTFRTTFLPRKWLSLLLQDRLKQSCTPRRGTCGRWSETMQNGK